jgi:hypothetical protein
MRWAPRSSLGRFISYGRWNARRTFLSGVDAICRNIERILRGRVFIALEIGCEESSPNSVNAHSDAPTVNNACRPASREHACVHPEDMHASHSWLLIGCSVQARGGSFRVLTLMSSFFSTRSLLVLLEVVVVLDAGGEEHLSAEAARAPSCRRASGAVVSVPVRDAASSASMATEQQRQRCSVGGQGEERSGAMTADAAVEAVDTQCACFSRALRSPLHEPRRPSRQKRPLNRATLSMRKSTPLGSTT